MAVADREGPGASPRCLRVPSPGLVTEERGEGALLASGLSGQRHDNVPDSWVLNQRDDQRRATLG